MLAKTAVYIDTLHSLAICGETGFRQLLRGESTSELPPRLQYLMERLAESDRVMAPSLVPSIEDMIQQEPIDPRQERTPCESFDEPLA